MVEGSICPARGVVAGLAGCWEELRLRCVARIGRVVVIGLVTTDAGGWQGRVVAVHVTIGTLARRRSVRACQGERRVVVIKG